MRPIQPSHSPRTSAGAPGSAGGTPAASPLLSDHHLWRNGRLWWIAVTLYDAAERRHRVRRSLGTADVVEARNERDRFLARVRRTGRWRIAAPAARAPSRTADARSGAAA